MGPDGRWAGGIIPCLIKSYNSKTENDLMTYMSVQKRVLQFSFQIFNAARKLSRIEAAPDKSGLVLLDYWVGLKRCLVIIHN